MPAILFVSPPLAGHTNQLLVLAQEMKERGHTISFATSEKYRSQIGAVGAVFIPWEPRITNVSEEIVHEFEMVWTKISQGRNILHGEKLILQAFIPLYKGLYEVISKIYQQNHFDLVVADSGALPAIDSAIKNKSKVIEVRTFLGNSVPAPRNYPQFETSFLKDMTWLNKIQNYLYPTYQRLYFHSALKKLDEVRSQCTDMPLIDLNKIRYPILVGTTIGLEFPRSLPSHVQMIGPIFFKTYAPLSGALEEWISKCDENKPIVYVSFGTLATLNQQQLEHLAHAFSDKKFQVIWSLRKEQQRLLPALPDSIRVEEFVPQVSILASPKVKLFLSHCGMNGINESLINGKPILCLPIFGDQHYNAARIVDARAGLRLNKLKLSSKEIKEKIFLILTNPIFKTNAIRLSEILRSDNGLEKAVSSIETTLQTD